MRDCIAPLILASLYFAIYACLTTYLLVKNKFLFTFQIKVVLTILMIALSVQFGSCYMIYATGDPDDDGKGLCRGN